MLQTISDENSSDLTRRMLLRSAARALREAGIERPLREAAWLLAEALGLRRLALHTEPEHPVGEDERARAEALLARRAAGEPLQYVLGHTDFYGLRLRVTPAVLIARPETEEVVEEALRLIDAVPQPRVLDAGAGSGCIACAVKHARPDARVVACDVSRAALAVAAENAAAHRLDITFRRVDLLAGEAAERLGDPFDLILSNPPYLPEAERAMLPPDVRDHEPPEALFCAGDPLLFYRKLAADAHRLLTRGGRLDVETHAHHAGAVRDLLTASGLEGVHLRPDLAGRPRIAHARRSA